MGQERGGPERGGPEGGGQDANEVRARTEDLRVFFQGGERYVSSLQGIFDEILRKRTTVTGAVGTTGTPLPMVAKADYGGSSDPLAELLAEAKINNAFVETIHDALEDSNVTVNGRQWARVAQVDAAVRSAGLGLAGEDFGLQADQELVAMLASAEAKEEIRTELDDVLTSILEDGVDPYGTTDELGLAVDNYVASLEDADPAYRAAAAEVLVEYGIDLQVDLATSQQGYEEGLLATMLVNQGLGLMPDNQAAMFADTLANTYPNPNRYGPPKSALDFMVDALDLEEEWLHSYEVEVAWQDEEWKRSNQPWIRQQNLDRLITATIGEDGAISASGQQLVNYTLDTYPGVLELAAEHRFHTDVFDDDPEIPDEFDLRATFAIALAAPNYGLNDRQWDAAQRVAEIDTMLATGTLSDVAVERLWLERRARISEMADGGEEQRMLILEAMSVQFAGPDGPSFMSPGEAARLAEFASSPFKTDDRVARLRLVYETTEWGDPVPPGQLEDLDVPSWVAQSLAIELSVLQPIQESRFNERNEVEAQYPLEADQLDLLNQYAEFQEFVENAYPLDVVGFGEVATLVDTFPGHDRALAEIADGSYSGPELPPGLRELAIELSRSSNDEIWEVVSGASRNDTFLQADGSYKPGSGGRIKGKDLNAFRVQMQLLGKLGPHQQLLDLDGDGTIHENEVEKWLERNEGNRSIPPSLVDQVRFGERFGVGEDTFDADEIAAIIGIIGLVAAATVATVYSGPGSAPLWVKAGIVALGGLEAYYAFEAGDGLGATLATTGLLADGLAGVRLLLRTRAAMEVADGPQSVRIALNAKDELVDAARLSNIAEVRELAEQAGELGPTQFINRYLELVTDNRGRLIGDLHDQGYTSGQIARALEDLDFPPTNTAVDGIRASDADRHLIGDPSRQPTVQPHPNGNGTQVVIQYGPKRGQLATVVNSRNVQDGYYLLPDGTKVPFSDAGFPILDSQFDLVLDRSHLGTGNEGAHFAAANEELYEAIRRNPGLADEIGLNDAQLAHIWPSANGKFLTSPPPGFSWHHHEDLLRMQLVPAQPHGDVRHLGGMAIWGGGRGGRNSTESVQIDTLIERSNLTPAIDPSGAHVLRDGDRTVAIVDGERIEFVYDGFGGNIVADPDRATTVLGKYVEPDLADPENFVPGVGTRELLGNAEADIPGLPNGALVRGEGGNAGPGDINSLDIPNDRYEAIISRHANVLRQTSNILSEDEVMSEALRLANQEFWEEYNLPFLVDAFERGDNIRLLSDPEQFAGSGYYGRELEAIEGTDLFPGLADKYGYEFDATTATWRKVEE